MNYYQKYLKYKTKYLFLEYKQFGAGNRKIDKYISLLPPAKKLKGKTITIDDKNYLSVKQPDGTYIWILHKSMYASATAYDYFMQIPTLQVVYNLGPTLMKLKKIQEELAKQNILFYEIEWHVSWDDGNLDWNYFTETAVENGYMDYTSKGTYTKSFLFFSNFRLFWATIDGELHIQHDILKKDIDEIINIFRKHLGQKFVWNGKQEKTILVKIEDKIHGDDPQIKISNMLLK